jgi:sugar lactone lactonase YvrE
MTIDRMGGFKAAEKSFGGYFEKISSRGSDPTLIMCSDFPVVVNKDGNLYYVDTRRSFTRIVRRTAGGKESVVVSNKIFEFASGIAAGADGSLFITEASNPNANTIRKITLNGNITTVATYKGKSGKVPLETTASYCRGLAVDSTGTLYVAATGSRSVLKISPEGKIKTVLKVTGPWSPTGIATVHGEIYVLEWHDVTKENLEVRAAYIPRVRKIAKNGNVTTLVTISRQ